MTYRFSILILLSAALAPSAAGQGGEGRLLHDRYNVSVMALAATQAADVATSVGRHELNPVLGSGRFGARQVTIKAAIVGGSLLAQRLMLRSHDHATVAKRKRIFARMNFIMAGVTGVAAISNARQR